MSQTRTTRAVGRPREFDEDAALDAAMHAFWHKGFEATSLADLCQCTGLHKGSLYQAFGDKRQLFMRAVERYVGEIFELLDAARTDAGSPLETLRHVMHGMCANAAGGHGCLLVNSMVELGPHDDGVRDALRAVAAKDIDALTQLVTAAREAGEIRAELEPVRVARQLMVTLAGLATTTKCVLPGDAAVQVIDDTLAALT